MLLRRERSYMTFDFKTFPNRNFNPVYIGVFSLSSSTVTLIPACCWLHGLLGDLYLRSFEGGLAASLLCGWIRSAAWIATL